MNNYNISDIFSSKFIPNINFVYGVVKPIHFVVGIIAVCILLTITCLLINKKSIHKNKKETSNLPSVLSITSYDYLSRKPNHLFSKKTKSIKVEELNKDLEPFGFAYYPQQDIFYSIMDGWQRDCGYCELYDEASAALSMIIDCEPIRFEYNNKRWLIEIWKGQYGLNTGCEIGLYSTDGPNLNIPGIFDGTFYFSGSDEDRLYMSFSLRKNGTLLFYRSDVHWWLTGFKLGEFSDPSDLEMTVDITLKNHTMCNAFLDGLYEAGYSSEDITVNDTTVHFIFDKPHAPQPSTRNSIIENFMQTNNQRNCEAYQFATRNYKNTLDKLILVKEDAPKLYRKIVNVGNTKELFGGFKVIKEFVNLDRKDWE